MRRGRALLLASLLSVLAVLSLGPWPKARMSEAKPVAPSPIAARPGDATILIEDRVSFEEIMAVPTVQRLARSGGAALMATDGSYRGSQRGAYRALGSGAAPDSAPQQLLGRTLIEHGVGVCVIDGEQKFPDSSSPVLLLGVPAAQNCRGVIEYESVLFVLVDPLTLQLDESSSRLPASTVARRRAEHLVQLDGDLRGLLDDSSARRSLFMVVTPSPSASMIQVGDEVTPLVMAEGPASILPPAAEPLRAVTSDSTRQAGLVSNVDVAPTILNFFGLPIPPEMDGQPIRTTDEPAPFALHRLELEQRRIRLPVQLGELAFVVATGIAGVIALLALAVKGQVSARVAAALRFVALCGAAICIPLYAGGLLPRLTYGVVVPFLVLTVVGLATAARLVRWPGPLGSFTFLGAVGVVLLVVDSLFGGRAGRIPLLGGTMFDGVRFYGLPNSFIALVLASALFVAARLKAFPGFVLLVAAALYAGMPTLGANLGAAVEVFAAAGLWWVLRTHRRIGPRDIAVAAGIAIAGTVAVLLFNRLLPGAPTHISRFVQGAGSSGGWAATARHRLGTAFGQVLGNPAAFLPLIGLPVLLTVTIRRPRAVAAGLALEPSWQAVLITLIAASVVGFFVNDTGVSAAAPGFLYAMSALVYPVFLAASTGLSAAGEPAPEHPATVGDGQPSGEGPGP